MTPVEVALGSELNVEWQKFSNGWLLKWHGITYEGGITDVDDFRGGRIHYGGILSQTIHSTYKEWDEKTRPYPLELRKSSLDGTGRSLRQFDRGGAIDKLSKL